MTTKNKKLPNHITKLNNGKYRVRYRKSYNYPIAYSQIFDNEEDAIKANNEYLAKNTLNLLSNNTKIGFCDFCDYYMNWYINKPKRPSHNTIKGYYIYINRLKIIFGNQNIDEITSHEIEIILNNEKNRQSLSNGIKEKRKISENTLHHEYAMMRALFNKAYNWGFIKENPIAKVEEPIFVKKEIIIPEFSEFGTIKNKIMTAPIRERCQFLLALYTGMREEEICGVHLKDFNRLDNSISVKRAIVQNEQTKEFIEDRTKSQASMRTIPIPDDFFIVLD